MQQHYLRARYYSQATGRFNQLDPFTGSNFDPQSLHKYAYVHQDPINGVDPSGTFTLTELLVVALLVGVLFSGIAGVVAVYQRKTTQEIWQAQANGFAAGFGVTISAYGGVWAARAIVSYAISATASTITLTFTATTAAYQLDPTRRVPYTLLQFAIQNGSRMLDPQGAPNAFRYTVDMMRNGKLYELEVVAVETSPGVFLIYHFLYQ